MVFHLRTRMRQVYCWDWLCGSRSKFEIKNYHTHIVCGWITWIGIKWLRDSYGIENTLEFFLFLVFFLLNVLHYELSMPSYMLSLSFFMLSIYPLSVIFYIFFFLSHILLVIFHELLVIHSSTLSYPCIAINYLFIN